MSADERPGLVGLVQALQEGYGVMGLGVANEVRLDMDRLFWRRGPTPRVERLSEIHMHLLAGREAGA